ncbi:MAG: FAD-dependent monooxygenase, partial [Devosiaceae bacterium]|nr:FAD-dependent monooxygenase [Devosiaceae bacterium]
QFSVRSFDMQAHQKGLSLTVENRDGSVHNTRPYAFVGADGVHSLTRTKILAGPDAQYSNYIAWRALIPSSMPKDHFNLNNTSLMWGPGFHTIAYPHPKRHVVNIAMFTKEKLTKKPSPQAVLTPDVPKAGFACTRTKAIINAAEGGWKKWPLYAAQTSQWYKGPVGLIGDAAHAMLPYQAQGAAMAIEDVGVLAPLLAKTNDATKAFATYQSIRQSRVKRIVKTSASNGRIYHMEWPFSIFRDIVVSVQGPTAHLQRLAWIYGYETPKLQQTSP